MRKHIKSYNDKGQLHGYSEHYWGGQLWFKTLFNNGSVIGYTEKYPMGCNIITTKHFYIK